MRFDGGKVGWIEFKFELKFSWLNLRLTSTTHSRNSYAPRKLSLEALKLTFRRSAMLR
jgi:hypothetical protein